MKAETKMTEGAACSIDGCDRPTHARGWCGKHYLRWMKTGDPMLSKKAGNRDGIDFVRNVAVKATGRDCVLWPFSKDEHGRGTVRFEGKYWHAARLVCWLTHGPAPADQPESAHSCGKGHLGCVSGNHLRWASRSENLMDKVEHGTHNRGQRHPENKLTKDDIIAIRELRGQKTQRAIAAEYGISPGHVSEIQTGKTWSWL